MCKPGKNIIPGTQKILSPETYLRVVANETLTITRGEKATGSSSNASGPISKVFDKNNIAVTPSTTGVFTLTNDQVYTLAIITVDLSFKMKIFSIPSVTETNNANNTTSTLKLPKTREELLI